MVGLYNAMAYFNGVPTTVEDNLAQIDKLGGPESYPHMAIGWAYGTSAPFAWMKQVASDFGGTQNPMIMRWPGRFKADDKIRSQFHHVTDVAPTVLDAAGLPEPTMVNGVKQVPMAGTSMLYAIDDPDAETTHPTQYFEIMGNRAIYHEGWLARVIHFLPWESKPAGGLFGGWAAWLDDGVPVFTYNYLATDEYSIRGSDPLPKGENEIVFDFDYEGGKKPGQGGTMTISVGGKKVGEGRIDKTQPLVMGTEAFGVGHDSETPVVADYGWAPRLGTGQPLPWRHARRREDLPDQD